MYLCDGYGSDHVYAFERSTGTFMNQTFGGRSPAGLHPGVAGALAAPHGKFMENHGCTYVQLIHGGTTVLLYSCRGEEMREDERSDEAV